ncbi:hypothetical protein BN133_100 [Cronobacter dublinensis 582]|nr:hypothetical protein BN133_100 [Cronobacter dublinensis 582]
MDAVAVYFNNLLFFKDNTLQKGSASQRINQGYSSTVRSGMKRRFLAD